MQEQHIEVEAMSPKQAAELAHEAIADDCWNTVTIDLVDASIVKPPPAPKKRHLHLVKDE